MSKAVLPPWHTGRAASSVLNLDVLCRILLFVDTHRDLLATMMTCHALYNAGIQPLVQLPIKIYAHTIHLFHDFMLAHSHLTFLVFRELRVEYELEIPSCEDTYLILELLERGTKLKQLELPSAIFDTKEIGEAVVCLTELQELALEGPCYYSISRILTRLHSPLTNIDIVFENHGEDEDEDVDVDVTYTKNPVLLLANFQTTLERASITSSQFFSEDVCYPKLLDLDLQLSGGPSLSVLATAFPNLKTLSIGIKTEMEHAELTILRHQNVIFQDGRKCWESLISVHADSVALYAMGLKHTLKSVTIPPLRKLTPVHLSFLRAVISTTKTKALSLHLQETPGILSEVLCDVGNPLIFLELKLQIRWGVDHEKTLASTSPPTLFSKAWLTVVDSTRTTYSKDSLLSQLSCFNLCHTIYRISWRNQKPMRSRTSYITWTRGGSPIGSELICAT